MKIHGEKMFSLTSVDLRLDQLLLKTFLDFRSETVFGKKEQFLLFNIYTSKNDTPFCLKELIENKHLNIVFQRKVYSNLCKK